MPVATELAQRARAAPDRPALIHGDRIWSATELAGVAGGAASVLRVAGVSPGDRVALLVPDPALALIWLLGTDSLGATPALLDPAWPAAMIDSALAVVAPVARVGAGGLDPAGIPDARGLLTVDGPGGLICFTSGTSAAPRAVARTRASWTASFPAFSRLTGIGASDEVAVPGPLTSSLFCFAAAHTVAVGATVRLASRWDDTAGCTVVHLVPAMLRSLVGHPALQVVVCAGAKLPPSWVAGLPPGTRLVEYYGSTEQSFVALRVGGDPRTVGPAFPGVQVQIRDGEIWSRGPFTCHGYVGPAGGPLRRDGDWTTVGDHGRLDPDGALVLTGRGDGLIQTGGSTVHPQDVEDVLHTAPGVTAAVVVGTEHPRLGQIVTAVIEPAATGCDVAALRAHAALGLAKAQRPRRWYVVDALPRTAGGKPARAAIAAALADGTLPREARESL